MTDRIAVDPVALSCAVRYALGRHSYLPGLICDEVRRCWDDLGAQREVIRADVAEWVERMGDSDYVAGAGWSTGLPKWVELLAWIDARPCPSCGCGSDDTFDLDWDVIFGHEQCRNPRCQTRRNTEGAPPSP